MPEHTCETCRFWNLTVDYGERPEDKRGQCRIHPPDPVWGMTNGNDWCGEHQEKRC
jgi:hypothetical protein